MPEEKAHDAVLNGNSSNALDEALALYAQFGVGPVATTNLHEGSTVAPKERLLAGIRNLPC